MKGKAREEAGFKRRSKGRGLEKKIQEGSYKVVWCRNWESTGWALGDEGLV